MSRNRDKDILIEADPEPERTLKRKLREAKAQYSEEDLTEIFETKKETWPNPITMVDMQGRCLVTLFHPLPTSMEEASQFLQLEQTTLSLSLN